MTNTSQQQDEPRDGPQGAVADRPRPTQLDPGTVMTTTQPAETPRDEPTPKRPCPPRPAAPDLVAPPAGNPAAQTTRSKHIPCSLCASPDRLTIPATHLCSCRRRHYHSTISFNRHHRPSAKPATRTELSPATTDPESTALDMPVTTVDHRTKTSALHTTVPVLRYILPQQVVGSCPF